MNIDRFWALIGAAGSAAGGEVELPGDTLRRVLSPLIPDEIGHIAGELFEEKTGSEMEAGSAGQAEASEPAGHRWEEHALPRLLPRLGRIHSEG